MCVCVCVYVCVTQTHTHRHTHTHTHTHKEGSTLEHFVERLRRDQETEEGGREREGERWN